MGGIPLYPTVNLTASSRNLLLGVPTMQIGRRHPGFEAPFVGTDDTTSIATLVRHLIDLAHERIAYIGSDPNLSSRDQGLAASRSALASLGRSVDESLFAVGLATAEAGMSTATRLPARKPRPTWDWD